MHYRQVLIISILVATVLGLICIRQVYRIRQNTLTTAMQVSHHHLLIQPDQLKVNGNLLAVQGHELEFGQPVSATAFIKEHQMVDRLAKIDQPILLTVNAQLQPLMPPTNINEHDYRPANYHFGICNHLQINQIESYRNVRTGKLHLPTWRARALHYFQCLPRPLTTYCCQLILGQSTTDNTEFMQSIKRLGIIHLFCISGMHVSVIIWGIRRLLVYCWFTRERIDWLLIIGLPIYAILAGGSIGLIRAILMAEASLISRKYYPLTALDTWSISLIGGLVINPWLLLSLGGQLSYLLSLTLQVIPTNWHPFRQSVVLNLFSLPSILSFIYQFHWLSFITSFLMIPVFTVLIFPLVILSAVTFWCLPQVAEVTNRLLLLMQRLLIMISHWPGMITFGKPPILVAILLLFLTAFVLSDQHHLRWYWLLIAYLLTWCGIRYYPLGEVTFVDIGQGDSIILRSPFGQRVELIDTGGKLQFIQPQWARRHSSIDVATRTSINYLNSRGINKIDTIYLSHHDIDHIGYLPTILDNFHVQQIVVPKGMEKQSALKRLLNQTSQKITVIGAIADQHCDNSSVMVLHPFQRGQANNEDSLVLWGPIGKYNFIFTGDLDRNGERALIKHYPHLRSDVVKLGHHGSRTASDPRYLNYIGARWGIISAGRHNRYGHPNLETLETLRRENIKAISTQQYGMIRYQYFGHRCWWRTALKGDELQWTLKNLNDSCILKRQQ